MQVTLLNPIARSIILICATTTSSAHALDICPNKASRHTIHSVLSELLNQTDNSSHLWGTIVNSDGTVCAVTQTEGVANSPQSNSRLIAAQKANTANTYSLPSFALSTANLHHATQHGGALFGLYEVSSTDIAVHLNNTSSYGTVNDPMIGDKVSSHNVSGGGLALYDSAGILVGALGISGDSPCTNHHIAWKIRHKLSLDFVPAGPSSNQDDQIIYTSEGSARFDHPDCGRSEKALIAYLPNTQPIIK